VNDAASRRHQKLHPRAAVPAEQVRSPLVPNKSPIDPQATMNRKRFKPSLASICAVSVDLRLTPGGKEATRKAFTEADLKRALEHGDKKSAGRLASWHRPAKISQLRADASAALPAGQPARPQPLRSLHGLQMLPTM
jgi:hypothetical protein